MEYIYFTLVAFLIGLAIFDLFVGVSNDAVNFMQSAIGARVASYRTVLIVASAGVLLGAALSQGMMDVARHGIIVPSFYSLAEVMVLFMAVMVANVFVLHIFNSLGMPTSTTVSLVFALLGGAVIMAILKTVADPSLSLSMLVNTDKALQVIIAIFVSVAIAFTFGLIVQWLARIVFTFEFEQGRRLATSLFGGLSVATLSYFIFLKGVGSSPLLPTEVITWVANNIPLLLAAIFVLGTLLSQLLSWFGISVFRIVILMGTFALAMAFAGNDLVNFIGVPLAGLDAVTDYHANGGGAEPTSYLMSILATSATTPPLYLLTAGIIMVVAMATSKKSKKVIQTGIDLSRQDEGDEMFGSSPLARSLVRGSLNMSNWFVRISKRYPSMERLGHWVDSRFVKPETEDNGAAFDLVRASVNLVLAALLITVGTNLRLPLSTTYVTFMVAMGSSLADRAWKRESAVFRVTGVVSVIGGWFVTAGASFVICAIVAIIMYYGGLVAQLVFVGLVIYLLARPEQTKKKSSEALADDSYRMLMRTKDADIVWLMLRKLFLRSQTGITLFALEKYNNIVSGLLHNRVSDLRGMMSGVAAEKQIIRKQRKQQLMGLRRCPTNIAVERNTWFHVCCNASEQYMYCLLRMWEPIYEHVSNNFKPLPADLVEEYEQVSYEVSMLMKSTEVSISTARFDGYREVMAEADALKDRLSQLRHKQMDRMQKMEGTELLQVYLVYLNLLQETQQLLSHMRHQLRTAKKFLE